MNKIALRSLYVSCILLMATVTYAESASYSLQLHFDGQNFSLEQLSLVEVSPMQISKDGEYTIVLLSHKDAVLFESAFYADLRVLDAEREFVDDRSFDFIVPYYSNARAIHILKEKGLLLEVDVSRFSQCNENKACEARESLKHCPLDCTCGNKNCEPTENYALCQQDCPSGHADGVCDGLHEGKCDPDCRGIQEYNDRPNAIIDYDCGKEQDTDAIRQETDDDGGEKSQAGILSDDSTSGSGVWIGVLATLAILACGYFLWNRRNRR